MFEEKPGVRNEKALQLFKDRVTSRCEFQYFREDNLWYKTADGWLFPVPIDELGTADLNASEKGMTLMRWVRKHMDREVSGNSDG